MARVNEKLVEAMRQRGQLVRLPNQAEGVPVALHYRRRLASPSKVALRRAFADPGRLLQSHGATISWKSLSPSGQIVEAVIPVSEFANLAAQLRTRSIDVVPMVELQIV
jgi:hypothetical protein